MTKGVDCPGTRSFSFTPLIVTVQCGREKDRYKGTRGKGRAGTRGGWWRVCVGGWGGGGGDCLTELQTVAG